MFYECYKEIFERARNAVPYEIGGFIIGYVTRWNNEFHVVITGQVPVKSKSTRLTVEFLDKDAALTAETLDRLQRKGYYVVGWYHSHPGYSCYPSRIDLRSHITYFREFYHVGLIVDPIRNEACVFKALSKDDYILVPFYVWRKKQ